MSDGSTDPAGSGQDTPAGEGLEEPLIRVRPPGPNSRTWLTRATLAAAPMGPPPPKQPQGIVADVPAGTIVLSKGKGSNVFDVDDNRYVDLAAGFGALLLGHAHPRILRVLALQSERLLQALGDVFPSDAKVALLERLARLYPEPSAKVILGQSGADAVSAALKTAALYTGKPSVIAFAGGYHGLSYGPLAVSDFRQSYREPFLEQLNPHVRFVPYPRTPEEATSALEQVAALDAGCVLVEPILGRGGCIVPPAGFLRELGAVSQARGALVIADEIWTGLGRSGSWLHSVAAGMTPDLICLGKGLGGGLPISACIGRSDVMAAWRREREVVHTSTYAGAPLACAAALATLDVIGRDRLVERSARVGAQLMAELRDALPATANVRGQGLMVAFDVPGSGFAWMGELLRRGYVTSSGGTTRQAMVLTPPLTIGERQLQGFVASAAAAFQAAAP